MIPVLATHGQQTLRGDEAAVIGMTFEACRDLPRRLVEPVEPDQAVGVALAAERIGGASCDEARPDGHRVGGLLGAIVDACGLVERAPLVRPQRRGLRDGGGGSVDVAEHAQRGGEAAPGCGTPRPQSTDLAPAFGRFGETPVDLGCECVARSDAGVPRKGAGRRSEQRLGLGEPVLAQQPSAGDPRGRRREGAGCRQRTVGEPS